MFDSQLPISSFAPAKYNPRRIGEKQFEALRESIRTLGVVKPVIVSDGTIIAGHQRTKAITAEGIETTPAHLLKGVSLTEEIRFNQLHNGADIDGEDSIQARVPELSPGWHVVPSSEIQAIDMKKAGAARRHEMMRLLTKHGPWGGAVASTTGEIVSSADYAASCKVLNLPVHVCVIPEDLTGRAKKYLSGQYGEYSYAHLPRTTWAQALAQMNRLNGGGNENRSRTFERVVIPNIGKKERVLDFGAGKMAYSRMLRAKGYDIQALEFYLQREGKIAFETVQRHITRTLRDVEARGLFDTVVCDSVINSVDSVEAETAVLRSLASLCRVGGKIIFSGRSVDFENAHLRLKQYRGKKATNRHVQFLDENGISAIYSRGVWRYQKFHSIDQIRELTRSHLGSKFEIRDSEGRLMKQEATSISTSGWSVLAINERPSSIEECLDALRFEFNLPLPNGKRYGRAEDACKVIAPLLNDER